MKLKLIIATCAVSLICCLSGCTGTSEKDTSSAEKTATTSEAPLKPWEVMDRVAKTADAATQPTVGLTIDFGIKSEGNAMECKPGAGICSPPKLTGPRGNATAQVLANTLQISVNGNDLKARNPQFYNMMRAYGMNGVMTFEDTYTFDADISRQLGSSTPITIAAGSPMSFSYTGDTATQAELLRFYGSMPGNNSCVSFNDCTGTPYTAGVSFATVSDACACHGYTVFTNNTNGQGSLLVYMPIEDVVSQPGAGDCMPADTNWGGGYAYHPFTVATDYVFSDSATAAAMSVPVGSVLSAGQEANGIYFWPGGWCTLVLTLQMPENAGKVTKK